MTLALTIPTSASLLTPLVNSAIRSLALSGVAAIGLAAFRVKTTNTRLFTWSAVLYFALAMPILGWVLPPVTVATPAVLNYGGTPAHSSSVAQPSLAAQSAPRSQGEMTRPFTPSAPIDQETVPPHDAQFILPMPSNATSFVSTVRWRTVATGIYLAVALLLLVRFLVGLVLSHRLLKTSREIDNPRLISLLASRAKDEGLVAIPRAVESELTTVPLTMGVLRSTILLPVLWWKWDDAKLDAVVTHEVSHVERRDALTQRLSVLHRAIFWFSPLAWWLDRRLADLAEQASDEAALTCGADRTDYARTLLGFFEALQAAPGRVRWQGVSMAKAGQAEKRLERILSWKGSVAMRLNKSIAIAVLVLAAPVVYLTASVRTANHLAGTSGTSLAQDPSPGRAQPAAPKDQAAPAASTPATSEPDSQSESPATPAPAVARVGAGAPAVGVIAPAMPMAPRSPQAPAIWAGHSRGSRSSSGYGSSFAYGFDDEQRFVISTGKSDSFTMSGTREDARHVEKLKKQIPGDFIWFQRDEKSYVIRDQATVDRARKLWAPQEELGKKQEELGRQQEALGKQQEELSARMEQIHVNVPDMTAQLDKLKAELKQLNSNATMEQVGQIQSEIGELQSKIGDIQSQAGDQQGKLGEQMGALGEKQGKLGEKQGELGEQQGKLAEEASRQMKQLLDEAIAKGIAQPEL